jgi:DNA-binding transcriptional regulator LsrR (DeoR family)
VHAGGFLEPSDTAELEREGVVGDIATVFFRFDGSYDNIPLNARASGPELSLFRRAKHALCVVSGLAKAVGVRAALRGGLMSELIVDEPTARALLWPDGDESSANGETQAPKSKARV